MQIEFEHVTFRRGDLKVLDDFHVVVPSGAVLALVGKSGAGKSTVLKLVNRLLEPDSGAVRLNGEDTRGWDPYALRRQAGYVIQDAGLFPHMTIEENVGIVPSLEQWEKAKVAARTNELLALVGLSPTQYAARYPSELSGGERQRVGVARALALDPPVLLMDEPFGALDPITRAALRREFRSIQSRLRKSVILVTHDIAEAFALGDTVGVLEGGQLIAHGLPAEVRRSADPRVRLFLDALAPIPVEDVSTGQS